MFRFRRWLMCVVLTSGSCVLAQTALTTIQDVLYTATEKVVVEPFGIPMAAGDVLEVRWEAGESGYRATVRRPEKRPRRTGRK